MILGNVQSFKGIVDFKDAVYLITTRKEHILDNNSHEFHVF